jgi:hypothetical protein
MITSSTLRSVTLRGFPGRGSSTSPSSRRSATRCRHRRAVGTDTATSLATWVLLLPSAAQHDPRPRCQPRRRAPAPGPTLQLLALDDRKLDRDHLWSA